MDHVLKVKDGIYQEQEGFNMKQNFQLTKIILFFLHIIMYILHIYMNLSFN